MENSNYAILSRKTRALTQNISLIGTTVDQFNNQIYFVKGTTGNKYKVTMKDKPECSCYDFSVRNCKCKHIYFITLRVLPNKTNVVKNVEQISTEKSIQSIDSIEKVTEESNETLPVLTSNENFNTEVTGVAEVTEVTEVAEAIDATKDTDIIPISHLVFEDLTNNTFKFMNNKNNDLVATIYDYIEKTYDSNARLAAIKLYENNVSDETIMKDNKFCGVYIKKINYNLFELHMKTISKINKGWVFNSYSETVKTEKISRFFIVN